MNLTFYGAAKTVTGSCTMVEVAGNKFLIDCGMFQGKMTDQMLNYDDFPFDVNDIDFMILTHAHIDHSGRIPKLYKAGYANPIYATHATVDLCGIMLADSGHIQEKEIEWVNKKRRRAGKKENEPMYTAQDGIDSMKLFKGVDYNKKITINENISFTLVDAGHMLGSSIVLLDLTENGQTKRVVFTGDLGNKNMPIIKDPTYIEGADHLIMESTYGNRLHGKMEDQSDKFIDILLRTIERGGNLIIPSFAVGRTQEILYEINKYAIMNAQDNLKINTVYNANFYCGSSTYARFLIPFNKQLLVDTVSTCGIIALSKNDLLQYFRFYSCAKVLNEKSLAARESSQALFFFINCFVSLLH